jgi:hypothetical protein
MLKGFPMPPGGWKAGFKLEINSVVFGALNADYT